MKELITIIALACLSLLSIGLCCAMAALFMDELRHSRHTRKLDAIELELRKRELLAKTGRISECGEDG
jgi:hypothetical protein